MPKYSYPVRPEQEMWDGFKVWFTNNVVVKDGQSALEDFRDDYQAYTQTAITLDGMQYYLENYGIKVENGVVIGARLL